MFTLHINNEGVQDGAVAVSWCFTPEFAKMLAYFDIRTPFVYMIVVGPNYHGNPRDERRYAVPLDAMLHYIAFAGPGTNLVFACVAGESFRGEFLRPHERLRYKASFIDHTPWYNPPIHWRCDERRDGEHPEWGYLLMCGRLNEPWKAIGATSIAVEVPEGVFAKPPPAWLAAWVNWTYTLPPQDSCEFQRRLFGYALHLQFVQFAIVMTWRVTTYVVMKLALIADVSAAPILHPLTHKSGELLASESFVFLPVRWMQRKLAFAFIPATPLALIVLALIMGSAGAPMPVLVGTVVSTPIGLALVVLLAVAYDAVKRRLPRKTLSLAEIEARNAETQRKARERILRIEAKERAAEEAQRKREQWYNDPTKVAPLICTPEAPRKPITSVHELPAERRTIVLRVLDYKAHSCKPYGK